MSDSGLCDLEQCDKDHLEGFVCLLYDWTTSLANVYECRRNLFVKKACLIDSCPPTSNSLEQHTKRARYQTNIWINSLCTKEPEAEVTEWGWLLIEDGLLHPNWTTLRKASKACQELKKCTCQNVCGIQCGCKKSGMSCTERCPCSGYCE